MAKVTPTPTMRNVALALLLATMGSAAWAQDNPTPASSCWVADQDSGTLGFSGVTEGRGFDGVFESFEVVVCLQGRDLTTAEIEVTVDTASADTDSRDRDQTLKGEEFFFTAQFPEARLVSAAIEPQPGAFDHRAAGTLKLRDVELDQPVSMSWVEPGANPRLVGEAEIMRLDYNVGVGEFEDTDFIANEVNVEFDLGLTPAP